MAQLVKVKITPALKRLASKVSALAVPIDRQTARQAGALTIELMKSRIASGNSPIKGKGKFPKYKNPSRYPGSRKPKSPVNLHLTGQMLRWLRTKPEKTRFGWTFVVGYFNDLAAKKEDGHAKGVNKQPKRPTIPNSRQEFVGPITTAYLKIFRERIRKIIRKPL